MDKYLIASFTGENRAQQGTMKIWDKDTPDAAFIPEGRVVTFFDGESHCGLASLKSVEQESIIGSVADAGANLDRTLTITARPASTVGGSYLRFVVPAPKATGELTRYGQRATKAEGDALVTAWKTANGITDAYNFVRGVFRQRV